MCRLTALLIFSSVFCFSLTSQPRLTLESESIDLGQVYNGDVIKARIVIKSTGTEPLKIMRISTSCGCTTVKEPQGAIRPGNSDILEVEFNSSGFRGKAVKYVYLETNDPSNQHSTVTLSASIREELQPSKNVSLLWFGDVPVGTKAQQQYVLKNISPSPISIKGVQSPTKTISVVYDRKTVAPDDSVTLTVSVTPESKGYLNEMFYLETGSRNQRRVPIRVTLVGVHSP